MKSPHLLSCATVLTAVFGFANYTVAAGDSSSVQEVNLQADGPAKNRISTPASQDAQAQTVFFPLAA